MTWLSVAAHTVAQLVITFGPRHMKVSKGAKIRN